MIQTGQRYDVSRTVEITGKASANFDETSLPRKGGWFDTKSGKRIAQPETKGDADFGKVRKHEIDTYLEHRAAEASKFRRAVARNFKAAPVLIPRLIKPGQSLDLSMAQRVNIQKALDALRDTPTVMAAIDPERATSKRGTVSKSVKLSPDTTNRLRAELKATPKASGAVKVYTITR